MLDVFEKKSAKELYVKFPDGRMMPLEDLVKDYERLRKEETSKKAMISEAKDDKAITKELKVGEWFRIDRNVIDENIDKIYRKCIKVERAGKALWKRFKKANKIANEDPDQYPRLIETYILKRCWGCKTERQMRKMCEQVGEGMCDEVICYLELQMRICNGESVEDLVKNADKLPHVRVIKLRNGGTGYFGGGAVNYYDDPPADLYEGNFRPDDKEYEGVPYAFRRVLS